MTKVCGRQVSGKWHVRGGEGGSSYNPFPLSRVVAKFIYGNMFKLIRKIASAEYTSRSLFSTIAQ